MKRAACILIMLTLILICAACGADAPAEEPQPDVAAAPETTMEPLSGLHHVVIEIQDHGSISLELDADAAPLTVTNFISLARDGFYDGLSFHRVITGFMMQGGDPEGTGQGGSEQTVSGEFANNNFDNPLLHTRGAISMARAKDYNSASSQFFICQEDCPSLDGDYACFGYVTEGMEVVDDICDNTPVLDNNGTVRADYQPVITSVTVVD